MATRTFIFLAVLMFHCESPAIDENMEPNKLTLSALIPLPEVHGRIDHLTYDSLHHLVFIAALANNTVEVVNLGSKQVVYSIRNLHEPQGIVYIPSLQRLVVTNGENGTCVFYDTKNFQLLGTIELRGDADNIRYDDETDLLYVGYGNGAIGIIQAAEMKLIASIPLDGHPESFQISKKQKRIYVNVPNAGEIEVGDLSSHAIISKWENNVASSNFPMALDDAHDRIFVGYRNPATLRVINTQTGADIQAISCSGDADDVFYFAADSLVFVSAGKGFIDIFKTENELMRINHIPTSSGARTSLLLPAERKLLLAVPAHGDEPAAIWVYTINK